MRWRKEIIAFADAMEKELKDNDHKGGWSECTLEWLLKRIADERGELARAVARFNKAPNDENGAQVRSEAADIANFAMMVADNVNSLSEKPIANAYCDGTCLDHETIVCATCFDGYETRVRKLVADRTERVTSERLVAFVHEVAAKAFIRGEDEQARSLRKLAADLEAFAKKEAA